MSGINLLIQNGNKTIKFTDLDKDNECELSIDDNLDDREIYVYLDKENIISIHKYLEYLINKLD